jgi:hypothetical protein
LSSRLTRLSASEPKNAEKRRFRTGFVWFAIYRIIFGLILRWFFWPK